MRTLPNIQSKSRNVFQTLRGHKFIYGLLLLIGMMSVVSSAIAETNTWTGASGGFWNTSTNWSTNAVPTSSTDVIINSMVEIQIGTSPTINKLTVNNTAVVVFTAFGDARIITIDNVGSTIAFGSSLTLNGTTGIGIRSMSIAFIGTSRTMTISGSLILSAVGDGSVYNATNSLTTVSGSIVNSGLGGGTPGNITSTSSNLTFAAASFYTHGISGGSIPSATWNATSTCSITGITGTDPSGDGQAFGHLTYNCPGLFGDRDMANSGLSVAGNFQVLNTGTGTLRMSQTNVTVSGNCTISDNFLITGGSSIVLNVNGNFELTAGTLTMSNSVHSGTLNVKGNFSVTGGTLTETSTGLGSVNFTGTSEQIYTSGGTISNTINFIINSNAFLQMATAGTIVAGGGTFTVSNTGNAGKLGIRSTVGITSSGATGNVQVTGTRTYTGGNFLYNGTSAQVTGNGLATIVRDLAINNVSGVIASSNLSVTGVLTLQSTNPSSSAGSLDMGAYTLSMGATATTIGIGDVSGIITRTAFLSSVPYTFGNQYTFVTFQNVGTLPTSMSVRVTLGAAPTWKPGAINRIFALIQTGGVNCTASLTGHYLDSELNGNVENTLVIWRCIYPFTLGSGVEFGRSAFDLTNNWVSLSSLPIYLLPSTFGQWEGSMASAETSTSTWNGSVSTAWNNALNWTPTSIPSAISNVVIPDASSTTFDPTTITDTTFFLTILINNGGIVNASTGGVIVVNGNNGAWNNLGTFNANSGKVIFTNEGATISGTTNFYDVTIASGATLVVESGTIMRIAGTMTNNGIWRAALNADNTVEYNGTSQTVLNPNGATPGYYNLILSGSGSKTMPSTAMNIRGSFTMSGSASATALQMQQRKDLVPEPIV